MWGMHKASARLTSLDRILSVSSSAIVARGTATDPYQVHLASVPLERIQALTAELRERATVDVDDLDGITMRLLLNDYKLAVAHLRAVTNSANARLHNAGYAIHETRKTVQREQEMIAKRAGRPEGDV